MVFYGDTDVYFDTSNYRLSIVVSAACLTACPPACHAEGDGIKSGFMTTLPPPELLLSTVWKASLAGLC